MTKIKILVSVILAGSALCMTGGCAPKTNDQGQTVSGDAAQLKQAQQNEIDRLKNNKQLTAKGNAAALKAMERGKAMAIQNAPPPPPPMR